MDAIARSCQLSRSDGESGLVETGEDTWGTGWSGGRSDDGAPMSERGRSAIPVLGLLQLPFLCL